MSTWVRLHHALVLAVLASAGLGATVAAQPQGAQPPPSTSALVTAVARYVEGYQRAFLLLIADEQYEQVRTVDGEPAATARSLRGELFLTFLEAEDRWMAIHDFATVDGAEVPDREDLPRLIRQGSLRAVAPRLAARNARYNLGRVTRNFNEPTLALQVFSADRRSRFRFSREDLTEEAGVSLVALAFRERERPTLVGSVRGGPVFADGEAVVEAETGRIRRILMRFEDGPVAATLETVFARHADLGLWVPVFFTERYRLQDGTHGETIVSEARYTNYRRFETSGRLGID